MPETQDPYSYYHRFDTPPARGVTPSDVSNLPPTTKWHIGINVTGKR